jgi:hypothetical protein
MKKDSDFYRNMGERVSHRMTTTKISRVWGIFLLAIIICLCSFPAQAKYGGGTGEPNDPYLIYTAEQLNTIGTEPNDFDKHFKLMADIDLSIYTASEFNIIGKNWQKPFIGFFDGNNHTISNFTYSSTEERCIGLFSYVSDFGHDDVTIKDLGLIEPDIDAGTGIFVGALVGSFYRGTISGCYVEGGIVQGDRYVGGLVGETIAGNFINCHSSAIVSGEYYIGGLIGEGGGAGFMSHLDRPRLTNCSARGSVSGETAIGGLVGWFSDGGRIFSCRATGNVCGIKGVGGLVGINEGWGDLYGDTISNCYATGEVSGTEGVGGLVGMNGYMWNDWGINTISCSYSSGNVSGETNVGGLVGYNHGTGFVLQCYSRGVVEGNDTVGGLIGYNSDGIVERSFWDTHTSGIETSDGGTGKTTAEMQTAETFLEAGWDFVEEMENGLHEFWQMPEGGGYPVLSVFNNYNPPVLSGNGTLESPYLISSSGELGAVIHYDENACYRLTQDIDLSGITWSKTVIIALGGIFDGNGFTISNLTIVGYKQLGLFGTIPYYGRVLNLGIVGANVVGKGDFVGILAGSNSSIVTNCYSSGVVSGHNSVGGLVGSNEGIITDCYNTAAVLGNNSVGGLVGDNWIFRITNCYSTGAVTGDDYVGGLVGNSDDENTNSSFWDIETSERSMSAVGIGKTTAEMQTASTFLEAGWDFVDEIENGTEDIWWIDEGRDYPRLWWEAE